LHALLLRDFFSSVPNDRRRRTLLLIATQISAYINKPAALATEKGNG
jgi:hypothetical protein